MTLHSGCAPFLEKPGKGLVLARTQGLLVLITVTHYQAQMDKIAHWLDAFSAFYNVTRSAKGRIWYSSGENEVSFVTGAL